MLIEYHRNMLADKPRNEAFYQALKKVIRKNKSTVADVGSGTGLMAFLARKLGAKEVFCFEVNDVVALAEKLAKKNKISKLHFIPAHSTEITDLPPVDIVISETLGNYAFEENIIETLQDAKRFLKPDGVLLPQRIEHVVCPVVTDRFYQELTVWDDVGFGLDYSLAKEMSLNNVFVRSFKKADLLAGGKSATVWDNVDFRETNSSNREGQASWVMAEETTIYGFAVWWNCDVTDGVVLSTSPFAPKTHWEQLYFPVLEPVVVKKGETVSVMLASQTSYDEGTNFTWQLQVKKKGGKTIKQNMDLRRGY